MKAEQSKIRRGGMAAGASTSAPRRTRSVFDELPRGEQGHIDAFGHLHEAAGCWIVGWMPRPFAGDADLALPVRAVSAHGAQETSAVMAFYERPDLDQSRVGVIIYWQSVRRSIAGLRSICIAIDGVTYGLQVGLSTARVDDRALYDLVRPILVFQATETVGRAQLRDLTARLGYVGSDTISSLSGTVAVEVDESLICPPHGLLLKGWHLAATDRVVAIRVRSGARRTIIDFSTGVPVPRPDVIAALGAAYGATDPGVGFMVYLPSAYEPEELPYLEVELDTGERAYKALSPSRKQGLNAIRAVLEGPDCRYGDIDRLFDTVLGPAVKALNTARLAQPFTVEEASYGVLPSLPVCSLVIPLYGRIDYLEYQIALFSADSSTRDLELIYVLDDPPRRQELLTLADAVFARFRIPFRILISSTNRGFGPASNLGLSVAQAPYVAFVNSDVFPVTAGWAHLLIAQLKKNPKLGAIGPRLLYEDGSVQHEGCRYQTVSEYGDWTFIEHSHKGRRPTAAVGLIESEMITAACLMLSTKRARELEGFDEAYVVGDFEDADLCRRLRAKNLTVAVDPSIVCHHLERQSQARLDGHWRMNLTLYNAWVHERRWIAAAQTHRSRP